MIGFIWIVVAYYLPELIQGEKNPYKEALLARPWESMQEYVMVRSGAYMFYWLYYADGTRVCAESKPLVIWLQGGPGFAASGLANFGEIGPFNMNMEPRKHTWVKGRNVLLIDYPVGTGFSYVTTSSLHVKTDHEIASDLYKTITTFFHKHESFRNTPTYIFGQNYGGKICPRLAYYLHMAIQKKLLTMNFKGVGIGGGWLDPKESSLVYPEFLYHMGLIDHKKYLVSTAVAKDLSNYMDKEEYVTAEKLRRLLVQYHTEINFMNVYQDSPWPALKMLENTTNTYIKPTLLPVVNQKLEWKSFSDFESSLHGSIMLPSSMYLEMLLNGTKLKVAIYNGNLDAVTPIAGALIWVEKLKWNGSEELKNAIRIPIRGRNNGFYKEAKQMSFWCIYESGHWVPEDNPEAMEHVLDYVISDK